MEATTNKAVSANKATETPSGKRSGNYRGRVARPEDHKEVLRKTREFLDAPTNIDRLNTLVSALITHEIKARLQERTGN